MTIKMEIKVSYSSLAFKVNGEPHEVSLPELADFNFKCPETGKYITSWDCSKQEGEIRNLWLAITYLNGLTTRIPKDKKLSVTLELNRGIAERFVARYAGGKYQRIWESIIISTSKLTRSGVIPYTKLA